jgi:hypothetical protein
VAAASGYSYGDWPVRDRGRSFERIWENSSAAAAHARRRLRNVQIEPPGECRRCNCDIADGDHASDVVSTAVDEEEPAADPGRRLTQCYLRLANLPSCPLDRLSRYGYALWRQAAQILFALDAFNRRKPQEKRRLLGHSADRIDYGRRVDEN